MQFLLGEAATKRYIGKRMRELEALVDAIPLPDRQWQYDAISRAETWGADGHQKWRIELVFKGYDLGGCVLCELYMDGDLNSVLVVIHPHRRNRLDDSVLTQLRDLLPPNIAEKVISKMRSDVIGSRGRIALIVNPREVVKSQPPGLFSQQLLLLRAAMKWSELRDSMTKGLEVNRRAALKLRAVTPWPTTLVSCN